MEILPKHAGLMEGLLGSGGCFAKMQSVRELVSK